MANAARKRKRQFAPKTKTGCRTCKRRHLKCGEEWPECSNCLSARLFCAGYGIWGGGTLGGEHGRNNGIATRPAKELAPPVPVTAPALSRHHTPMPFKDITPAEQIGFDYFVNKTVAKIPGVFPSNFWTELVLQASASELPILHAAVALGSAHRSADLNRYGSSVPSSFSCYRENGKFDPHEAFALEQYNKSISQLRKNKFEEENVKEVRTALVACILYVSLELLRGDYSTAVTHTRHGLNLLKRLKRGFDPRVFYPRRLHDSVDDYLIEAFTRLSLQSAHAGSIQAICDVAHSQRLSSEWDLPHVFVDMFEARRAFDSLRHLILSLTEQCRRLEANEQQPSEEIFAQHQLLQKAMSTWLQTFTASVPTLQRVTSCRHSLGIPLLRLLHTMASIQVATMFSTSEACYDDFTSAFTFILSEIVAVYRRASEFHNRPFTNDVRLTGFSFTLDVGTIPLLSYVALKCRVPWLRRQAIAILLAAPHREGIWDGVVIAHNAERVMILEENGFFDQFALDLDPRPFDPPAEKNERYLAHIPSLPAVSRFRHVKIIPSRASTARGKLICWRQNPDCSQGLEEVVEDFDLTAVHQGESDGVEFPC
ncbi:hypothetical protein G647_01537 [Cladophialophora carrionii CBS 160.54]|uniref:Zn(2)-C6 fungal-type domain-containing protein n=1 Tax=Cladophialophora carrionii CBS 160.54 TaxID=1279043 RepID=V9DQ93_9EURO|nr:uncharacterized protein G647_01537 [Cladophialophora carrionii CBS 160.54]ETI29084.1 hypothetical protein G647_01537 [Cladophialophora carrionii CBS 160.54]